MTYFLNGALILNLSDSNINSIQIGLIIKENPKSKVIRTYVSEPVTVSIPPKRVGEISPLWNTEDILHEMAALGLKRISVAIGIINVNQSNGKQYSYDITSASNFKYEVNPTAEQLYQAIDSNIINKYVEEAKSRGRVTHELIFPKKE